MTSKMLVVALVGVGCVGAAGIGGYMAVRTSVAAPPAEAAALTTTVGVSELSSPPAGPTTTAAPVASREDAPPTAARLVPAAAAAPTPAQGPAARRATTAEPAAAVTIQAASPAAEPEWTQDVPAAPADLAPPPSSPAPEFDEAVVAAASVIGIRMDTSVSSETARVEDRVSARVTRDVKVDGRTVIPAGARLDGTVALVERGGRLRSRARIGVRFDTLVLGDTDRIAIQTETIFRDGEPPSNEATSKIGASAVVGSILGAVLGGRKGAAIGGAAGAAGGTAAVMAGDRNAATIASGSPLTVRLTTAVSVLVPHDTHDN